MKTQKKYFLVFILLSVLCKFNIYSQTYKPLLVDGNQWNVLHSLYDFGSDGYFYQLTEILKLSNDTTIDNQVYRKVLSAYDSQSSIWNLKGLIREDIAGQKVYYIPPGQEEVLLYDFDVVPGDTVKLNMFGFESKPLTDNKVDEIAYHTVNNIIENVDSILIGNDFHKQVTLRSFFSDEPYNPTYGNIRTWIEGIGGTYGLLSSSLPPLSGEGVQLLCFMQNDILKYKTNLYGFTDCFYWNPIASLKDVELKEAFKISPNPVSENLNLYFEGNEKYDIEILNIQGQKLLEKKSNYGNIEINVSGMPDGFYITRIQCNSGKVDNRIIIKNKSK